MMVGWLAGLRPCPSQKDDESSVRFEWYRYSRLQLPLRFGYQQEELAIIISFEFYLINDCTRIYELDLVNNNNLISHLEMELI